MTDPAPSTPDRLSAPTPRDGLRRSTDPRAVRTRSQIAEAAQALAVRGSTLSVSAVVREAGISRASFYAHFGGLEDLAVHLQETALAEILRWERDDARIESTVDEDGARRPPIDAKLQALHRFATHVDDHRTFYGAVLALGNSPEIERRVATAIAQAMTQRLPTSPVPPAGTDVGLSVRILATGYAALLHEWVRGHVDAPVAEIAASMLGVMPEWMYAD